MDGAETAEGTTRSDASADGVGAREMQRGSGVRRGVGCGSRLGHGNEPHWGWDLEISRKKRKAGKVVRESVRQGGGDWREEMQS